MAPILCSQVSAELPSRSKRSFLLANAWLVTLLCFPACASNEGFAIGDDSRCRAGSKGCSCTAQQGCDPPLTCQDRVCIASQGSTSTSPKEPTPTEATPSPNESSIPNEDDSKSKENSSSDEESSENPALRCESDSDCASLDAPCSKGRCVALRCESQKIDDHTPCDDDSLCTANDECLDGRCSGEDRRLLFENFSKGKGEWSTDSPSDRETLWEFGEAKSSDCLSLASRDESPIGEDPDSDHSEGSDNKIAGTRIGGCVIPQQNYEWDCLLSPKMNISKHSDAIEISYWRHLHTPPRRIEGRRGVEHRVYAIVDSKDPVILEEGYKESTDDDRWLRRSHTLTAKGRTLRFSVCLRSGKSAGAFAGWSIDDIRIRPKGCEPDL